MALPIAPTPVIKGKDSKRFNAQLKISEKKRVSKKEHAKGVALVRKILANSNIKTF